jgi:signal transduction histidine kinase
MRFGRLTISLGLPLFLGISSLASETQPIQLSEKQRAWIAQQKPLRVGVTPDWAPFSYFKPDGTAVGIDIEILKLIAQRTGLRFEIVRTASWRETLEMAKEDRLDLLTGVAETETRENFLEFTRPYFKSAVVIVAREGDHRFSHVAMLRDARVAMPRKFATTAALQKRLPSARLILADTLPECLQLVEKKKADAIVVNLFMVSRYLNDHPEAGLGISGVIPEFDFPPKLAVRRNQGMLIEVLDQGLASISQRELDTITSEHLLFGLAGEHRAALLRKRIRQIILIAAVVAALLATWNYLLCREVRARREVENELRQINRSLEVFSHSVSHDLRAPLRAISGFTEVLRQDCGDKIGAEGNAYLDRISTAVARMNALVQDVLAYSHVSRANLSISMVSLQDVLQQAINEFPVEQRSYFRIVTDLPSVPANPTLLSQCLTNLLSNAIKFVPKGRAPKICIGAENEGTFIRIWVEDNGIGIAPENQKRIFQMFERVPTGDYEGTGIGLAIVAKGVERMGGQVGVESRLGQGSRFWILLPASNPKAG